MTVTCLVDTGDDPINVLTFDFDEAEFQPDRLDSSFSFQIRALMNAHKYSLFDTNSVTCEFRPRI